MAGLDIPRAHGSGVAFVTGAGGFLGGAATAALTAAGWRVAAFGPRGRFAEDHAGARQPAMWNPVALNSRGLRAAAKDLGAPEIVFHAAGGASVGASLASPETDRERTVGSLRETLDFITSNAPEARLIYPSSAAVYGTGAAGALSEKARMSPISPYGLHKRTAEEMIAEARASAGLDAVIIRFFSVYGPGLRKQLLWELAGRLKDAPASLELSGKGEEARDFLYIDDAVRLIGLMAARRTKPAPLVINGGAGQAITVRQAAEGLCKALGASSAIGFSGQARPGDPPSLVADIALARSLGFEPQVSFEAGLERFAQWTGLAGS